jgi:hypothetical protein
MSNRVDDGEQRKVGGVATHITVVPYHCDVLHSLERMCRPRPPLLVFAHDSYS